MKTIEQLQAEQAAELNKLQREHTIAGAMPLAPDFVVLSKALPDSVIYKVKGVRGALEVFKMFAAVVPFGKLKDGCTRLTPQELVPTDKLGNFSGDYAAHLTVNYHADSHCRKGSDVKLKFFARIEGVGVVGVVCNIEGPDYIGGYHKFDPTEHTQLSWRGSAVVSRQFSQNPMLNGYADGSIQWGTGESGPVKSWSNIDYLICADMSEDLPAVEQSHAMGQLTNLCDELEPVDEKGGQ